MGRSSEGEFFSYMPKLDRRGFQVEVPVGNWMFYGLVHGGGKNSLCAFIKTEIRSEQAEVVLRFNKSNCRNSMITKQGTFNNETTFIPSKIQFCQNLKNRNGENCGDGNLAEVSSVKLIIPTIEANEKTEQLFIDEPSFELGCINLKSGDHLKQMNVPLGGEGELPFPIGIVAYKDEACQVGGEDYVFRRPFEQQPDLNVYTSIQNDGTTDFYNVLFDNPYNTHSTGPQPQPQPVQRNLQPFISEITSEVDLSEFDASSIYQGKRLEDMLDLDVVDKVAHTGNSVDEEPEWIKFGYSKNREIHEIVLYNRTTQRPRFRGFKSPSL